MSKTALVVGYGSIGQRHVRVLEALGFRVSIVSRRGGDDAERPVFADFSAACRAEKYDYVVVANESNRHGETLDAIAHARHDGVVLVEKPLFVRPARIPEHSFKRAGVGYNLRFHPVVRAIQAALGGRSVQMANLEVGQWLPDWRPTRDTRSTYSASRAGGGGALRDLSHELDLATWLFGEWSELTALGGKLGSVTIDADDGWGILLRCERCPVVNVHLDCLDRRGHRSITVQADGHTWRGDLVAGTLQYDEQVTYFSMERDETYASMHRSMFDERSHACTLEEGLRTVELIDAVECAARERRWVSRAA